MPQKAIESYRVEGLRQAKFDRAEFPARARQPITVVLDRIRQAELQRGAIFRLCDAFLVGRLIIGATAVELRKRKLVQAARGTQNWVPWEHGENPVAAVAAVKSAGSRIIAVEQTGAGVLPEDLGPISPVCLIFGSELAGVSQEIIDMADAAVTIPRQRDNGRLAQHTPNRMAKSDVRTSVSDACRHHNDVVEQMVEHAMQRQRRIPRKATIETRTASDATRQQLGWYLRNCALSPAAGLLERVMLARLARLKGDSEGDTEDLECDGDTPFDAKDLHHQRRELRRVLKEYRAIAPSDDGLELNAFFARDEFGLDQVDAEILLLLLRYELNSDLEQFADEVLQRLHGPSGAVAALLGIDRREARRRIGTDGPLIGSGLLCVSEDGSSVGLAGPTGYPSLPLSFF